MSNDSGKEVFTEPSSPAHRNVIETKTVLSETKEHEQVDNKVNFKPLPFPPADHARLSTAYTRLLDLQEIALEFPAGMQAYLQAEQHYFEDYRRYTSSFSQTAETSNPKTQKEHKSVAEMPLISANSSPNEHTADTIAVPLDAQQNQQDDMDLPPLPPNDDDELQEQYENLGDLHENVSQDSSQENVRNYLLAKNKYLLAYQAKLKLAQQTRMEAQAMIDKLQLVEEAQQNILLEREIENEVEAITCLFSTGECATGDGILEKKMTAIRMQYEQRSQQCVSLMEALKKIRLDRFQVEVDPAAEMNLEVLLGQAEQKKTKGAKENPPLFGSLQSVSINSLRREIEEMMRESQRRVYVIKSALFRLQGESAAVGSSSDLTPATEVLKASFKQLGNEVDIFVREKNLLRNPPDSSSSFTSCLSQSFLPPPTDLTNGTATIENAMVNNANGAHESDTSSSSTSSTSTPPVFPSAVMEPSGDASPMSFHLDMGK